MQSSELNRKVSRGVRRRWRSCDCGLDTYPGVRGSCVIPEVCVRLCWLWCSGYVFLYSWLKWREEPNELVPLAPSLDETNPSNSGVVQDFQHISRGMPQESTSEEHGVWSMSDLLQVLRCIPYGVSKYLSKTARVDYLRPAGESCGAVQRGPVQGKHSHSHLHSAGSSLSYALFQTRVKDVSLKVRVQAFQHATYGGGRCPAGCS